MAVSLEEDEKRKEDTGTMMQFDLSSLEKFQHSLILKQVEICIDCRQVLIK